MNFLFIIHILHCSSYDTTIESDILSYRSLFNIKLFSKFNYIDLHLECCAFGKGFEININANYLQNVDKSRVRSRCGHGTNIDDTVVT